MVAARWIQQIFGRGRETHLVISVWRHHDVHMRTTLTLDPDVAARVEQEMKRSGSGLKAVVNDALRRGLGIDSEPVKPPPFRVIPQSMGLRPGYDRDRMNQLADELEVEEYLRKRAQYEAEYRRKHGDEGKRP